MNKINKENNDFFALPVQEQIGLVRQAANQLDIPEMIIEKDLWICWLLETLFKLPIKMAFKGGTSLSKVFGLIKRFSEDCDITIDYRNFKPALNLKGINNTQLKKISLELKTHLRQYVLKTVMPYLKKELTQHFPRKTFEITVSEDGEQLHFYYPSVIGLSQGYLRDHVLLEFGVRNSTEPCEKHSVQPYVAQAAVGDIKWPAFFINTLSPLRTFWEKATLMHVECHRERMINNPERLSRHWYDLYKLHQAGIGILALQARDILKNVIEHKKAFFNAGYTHYDDCLSEKFRLIPEIIYLENLKKDFSKMIEAGMFHEAPPSFNEIIKELKELEEHINKV